MLLHGVVWLLVACFAPPGASEALLGEEERDGELLRIESFRDNAKSPRLIVLCDELHERWKDQDADLHGSLMHRALAQLNNQIGREGGKNWLAVDDRALRALERQGQMDLWLQEHLLRYLNSYRLNAARKQLGEAAFRTKRQAHAAAMLQTVALVERERDDSWDPKDLPASNLVPPEATGLPSGVTPEAIKDPALRALYEREIEANWKKADRYRQQRRVREMEQHFYPDVRKRLGSLYSAIDLEELARHCKDAGVSPAWREKLLDEVRQAVK